MKRALIVYHPDFDLPGKTGIEAAQQMAEQILEGNKALVSELDTQDAPQNVKNEVRRVTNGMQYYVRKVDI